MAKLVFPLKRFISYLTARQIHIFQKYFRIKVLLHWYLASVSDHFPFSRRNPSVGRTVEIFLDAPLPMPKYNRFSFTLQSNVKENLLGLTTTKRSKGEGASGKRTPSTLAWSATSFLVQYKAKAFLSTVFISPFGYNTAFKNLGKMNSPRASSMCAGHKHLASLCKSSQLA